MVQLKVNCILSTIYLLLIIFLAKVSATEFERFYPTSCKALKDTFANSLDQIRRDIVQIQVHVNREPFYVKCNQEIENGGWTVVLHRYNGDKDFNCKWSDCVRGFGNINGEFFIGLERLYDITRSTLHELMFVLEDFENETRIAKYDAFAIDDENNGYMIYLLGNYSGNAGDAFTFHAGYKFSAKDTDHTNGCAKGTAAPGWFNSCALTNIFGKYLRGNFRNENGLESQAMHWQKFRGYNYSLKRITMMIRPIN